MKQGVCPQGVQDGLGQCGQTELHPLHRVGTRPRPLLQLGIIKQRQPTQLNWDSRAASGERADCQSSGLDDREAVTESHGLGLVLLQDAAERGHVRDKAVHPAKLDLYEEGKGSM